MPRVCLKPRVSGGFLILENVTHDVCRQNDHEDNASSRGESVDFVLSLFCSDETNTLSDEEKPGQPGIDIEYTAYNAFELAAALTCQDTGLKQSEVAFFIRHDLQPPRRW
jgi:hypothetical protein